MSFFSLGCERSASAQKETNFVVKVWKSPIDAKSLLKTLKWTFPHQEVLSGKIPVLDGPTNLEMVDELFRIELLEQGRDRAAPLEYYQIGRSEDKRLCLFSGNSCIHRINTVASSDTVLEDALSYLEAQTKWTLFKRLDRQRERTN